MKPCIRTLATSFSFSLILSATLPAMAADVCSQLAERFAKDLSKLTDTELAELRTCVNDALRLRQQGPVVGPKKTMPMANHPPTNSKKPKELIGEIRPARREA